MPNPSCWPFQWWRGLPWGHCTAFLFRELWAQPATLWTGAVHAIGHAAVGGHGAFLLGYGNPWLRWEMIKPKMADLVGGIRKSVGIIFPGKKNMFQSTNQGFSNSYVSLLGCAPWCSRNVLWHWPPARCECSISKPTAHPKSNHILIRQLQLGFASEAPNKQTLRIFWWLLHSQCETNTQNILPFFGVVRECHGNFPQDFCWSVGSCHGEWHIWPTVSPRFSPWPLPSPGLPAAPAALRRSRRRRARRTSWGPEGVEVRRKMMGKTPVLSKKMEHPRFREKIEDLQVWNPYLCEDMISGLKNMHLGNWRIRWPLQGWFYHIPHEIPLSSQNVCLSQWRKYKYSLLPSLCAKINHISMPLNRIKS